MSALLTGLLSLICLLGAPDPWAPYVDALQRASSDPAGAAEALTHLAHRSTDSEVTREALWQAGRIYLDQLKQPEKARLVLEQLVLLAPRSRPGLRAMETLRWLEKHQDVEQAKAVLSAPTASAEQIAQWIERWPELAALRFRLAEVDPQSAEALAPLADDPELSWRALRAQGMALYSRGDLEPALTAFEAAGDTASARRVRFKVWLRWAYRGSSAVVFFWLIIALARGRRHGAWWPPPVIVLYLAPVTVACLLMAVPMAEAFAPAILILAVGAVAAVWIAGAGPPPTRPWLSALVRAGVMAAWVYAIIYHFDLLELLWHTLKYGPER
ncbi:MAG: tetratricopeptide repeat protein [Bradymonadia bacterium]